MELIAMNHFHGWMDDPDSHSAVFRDMLGLFVEERDLTPIGFPILSSITGKGRDSVWGEFFTELTPGVLAPITGPRTPGVFTIDYRVRDLDQAQRELEALGIAKIMQADIGPTRQWWYDPEKTFGIYIELSEFDGDDLLAALDIEAVPFAQEFILPEDVLRVQRLDHVHAWTADADGAARFFSDVFGMESRVRIDSENGLKIALVKAENDPRYIELFQRLSPDALKRVGPADAIGMFGLSYKVDDLAAAARQLEARGVRRLWSDDRGAAKQIMFASDRTNGVNIELCEYPGEDFLAAAEV